MSKKIVIVRHSDSPESQEHAEKYVRERGYEPLNFSPETIIEIMPHSDPNDEFYAAPFIIGATAIQMSMAGNVYFASGWQDEPYCQDIHMIAFRNGINIVTIPEA